MANTAAAAVVTTVDPLDQLYEHYNKLDSAKENIKQV